ncbi:MFS domain-containing protein [Aphelenchoides bicaudatus]|nr:MFS domain-containing protein [Aphelenchoides bicaudatus]
MEPTPDSKDFVAELIEKHVDSASGRHQNLGDFVKFGRYTVFIVITYEFLLMPQMFNMSMMIFSALAARPVSCGPKTFENLSLSEACSELKTTQQLTNCTPKLGAQFLSLGVEFGLFCETAQTVKHSISVQMFGVLIGAIIFGQLSDLFGRKRMMFVAHLGLLLFNFLASKATSMHYFTALQTISMIFVGGHNSIMHVFLIENVPKKLRVLLTTIVSYSPNFIILSFVAYVCQDWRTLLKVCSLLNIVSICFLLKHIWKALGMVLLKIEKFNGTATPKRLGIIDEIIEHEIAQNEEKTKQTKVYFWHLFCTWRFILYTFIISFSLCTTSLVSYALIFNMEKLPGTIYISTGLFGLFRYGVNLLVGAIDFFVKRAGRKFIHTSALSYILIMLLAIILTKTFDYHDSTLLRFCTITSAAMCSQLYIVNGIATSEIFPTAIRNLAVSFVQIFNRLGAVLAPHLFIIAIYFETLPYLIMFLMMFVSMLIFGFALPETKSSPMSDHMPSKDERISFERRRKSQMILVPTSAKLVAEY